MQTETYTMILDIEELPLEISALIQDFWLPRGYKRLKDSFDDIPEIYNHLSHEEIIDLLCRGDLGSPSANAIQNSNCWKEWRLHRLHHIPRLHETPNSSAIRTNCAGRRIHTNWAEWCQINMIISPQSYRYVGDAEITARGWDQWWGWGVGLSGQHRRNRVTWLFN